MRVPKYQVFISEKPIGFFDADQIRKIAADNTLCWIRRDGLQEGPFSLSQLRAMWDNGTIKPDCCYRKSDEEQWTPLSGLWHSWLFQPQIERFESGKRILPAFLLLLFIGGFGAHRFYLGHTLAGCLISLLSIVSAICFVQKESAAFIFLAAASIWLLIDFVRIVTGRIADSEGNRVNKWT